MRITTDSGDVLVQADGTDPTPGPDEILLIVTVRDEAIRIPYLLEYYRQLGVDRLLFIDNGSSDGTLELLLEETGVHVFTTDAGFAHARSGTDWVNAIGIALGREHWIVTVDADELLVYPESEQRSLRELTEVMADTGSTALLTFLLDMYARSPIREVDYEPGTPFTEACPYLDSDSYEFRRGHPIPVSGGPRQRLFWREGDENRTPPPLLRKIPLVRWGEQAPYSLSTHNAPDVVLARTTGALLHFKMFSDFTHRALAESHRGEHWDHGGQYEAYASRLVDEGDLSAFNDGSVRYTGTRQLVDLGLLTP